MSTGGGSVEKAWFYNEDTGAWFDVQYNPKEFKFDKPVQWQTHDQQGGNSTLEFQKAQPATMQVELFFDTTHDGSDVRTSWVNKLLELTNPEYTPGSGEAAELGKKRPPRVSFVWGTFYLYGVIEAVNVTYMMFSPEGTPLRARVSVKMKEWTPDSIYAGGGGGTAYDSAPVTLVQLQAGQTVTAVALANNTTTQAVCDANGIDDPLNGVQPGDVLAITPGG
ncbi:MAG: LysM peptidoglycan-binding domain-containing protein [Deltaproteobacteria bacterium]|nr:MAG: LysM peptidoglycan-binding domain-containing protein [Deltaproteobacteria bacterium]